MPAGGGNNNNNNRIGVRRLQSFFRGSGGVVRAVWGVVRERRRHVADVGVFFGAIVGFLLAHRRYLASLPASA